MAKISFIGAGSVVFTKNLICDILQHDALSDSVLCLMDIDPARLKVAEILARKVVAQLGVRARVESTLDLGRACDGAKYAVTTIQVGGYKPATVTDFKIPKKYGLRQTIGDTLGVGGVFRALRTMPELARVGDMLRSRGAEGGLLLNYSNPMAMNMMAIERATGVASVGLCHSVQGTSRQLAAYAALPYEDITYRVAGINHVAFFLEFKYRGQDAYPLLFKAMERPDVYAADKVRFEMMRRLGYFVTESSEHFSEYCPWFIHHGAAVVSEFGIPLDEYLRRCESIIATWKETERRMLADNAVEVSSSVEYGSQIIHAMETGRPCVVYGNVPNRHHVTNLPEGCCVEVPCLVDAQGIQPTHVGDLPPQLAAMCRSNIAVQELTVEAFLTGKREHIYHAVMMDPHTSSQLTLDAIWRMCDDLIDAHRRDGFLPQFEPARKNTGRSVASLERVFASIHDRSKAGGKIRSLDLVVTNETSGRHRGRLLLEMDRKAFASRLPSSVGIDLAPGETRRIPFTVAPRGSGVPLRIGIRSDRPGVLGIDYVQPARRSYSVGSDGLPVRVEWSGNVVAEGLLHLEPPGVRLRLRVADSNISINQKAFWEGSAVEVFFCSAKPFAGTPAQVVILPRPKNPLVQMASGQPLKGAKARVTADKVGYTLDVLFPGKAVGVAAGEAFLLEIQLRVNALGDAHGRVSQAWQESHRPQLDSTRFALITPAASR